MQRGLLGGVGCAGAKCTLGLGLFPQMNRAFHPQRPLQYTWGLVSQLLVPLDLWQCPGCLRTVRCEKEPNPAREASEASFVPPREMTKMPSFPHLSHPGSAPSSWCPVLERMPSRLRRASSRDGGGSEEMCGWFLCVAIGQSERSPRSVLTPPPPPSVLVSTWFHGCLEARAALCTHADTRALIAR